MKLIYSFLLIIFCNFSVADEVNHFKAVYKIPSDSTTPESYSTFDLDQYQVSIKNGKERDEVELSYVLPEIMAGQTRSIVLNLVINNGSEKVLVGKEATALCKGPWNQLKCEMRFNALDIDFGAVETYLRLEGKRTEEIDARLKILNKFSGDPIGFTEVIQ